MLPLKCNLKAFRGIIWGGAVCLPLRPLFRVSLRLFCIFGAVRLLMLAPVLA